MLKRRSWVNVTENHFENRMYAIHLGSKHLLRHFEALFNSTRTRDPSGKLLRSVGNVTADTIKHYIKESHGKPEGEIQSSGSRGAGQRRLDDFWIP